MDIPLQLCESVSNYPSHFEKFLSNCKKKYGNDFVANDYLFAAVYFILIETGFTPVGLTDVIENQESLSFDIKKLRSVVSYSDQQVKITRKGSRCSLVYQIPLRLGNSSCVCELQGIPSGEIDTHLIINILVEKPHVVKSLCLNTELYSEIVDDDKSPQIKLKNLNELSRLIKNKISVYVKDLILMDEKEGCYANILRLPEKIQTKIIYFLSDDAVSVTFLSSTCTYFYNMITNDIRLWEIICFNEYKGRILNDALHEVMDSSADEDLNLFRMTFLTLKRKSLRLNRGRSPEPWEPWLAEDPLRYY